MSSWKVVFEYSRKHQVPLNETEEEWLKYGHQLRDYTSRVNYPDTLSRVLNFLDALEVVAITGNGMTLTPDLQGGGWLFSLSEGKLIQPEKPKRPYRDYPYLEDIVRSVYPGALPDLESERIFLSCPVVRAAFGLVPRDVRARNAVELRRKLLDHHGVVVSEELSDEIHQDALHRILDGEEVLERIIDKDALAAFNGDRSAYMERAVRRFHSRTWSLRNPEGAVSKFQLFESQFPEIPRSELMWRYRATFDDTPLFQISTKLLGYLGQTREETLSNIADIALLSDADKERVLQQGLVALIPFLERLNPSSEYHEDMVFEHVGAVRTTWLEHNAFRFDPDKDVGWTGNSFEDYVIAELVYKTAATPRLADLKPFLQTSEYGLMSCIKRLEQSGLLEYEHEQVRTLTNMGLEFLSSARAFAITGETTGRLFRAKPQKVLPDAEICRPSISGPRPPNINGFPPEVAWLHVKMNHIDHDSRASHTGRSSSIGRNGLPNNHPDFYITSVMTVLGERARIYEVNEARPVDNFIMVVDERYILSPKLINRMQVEFKPDKAIDLAKEEGAERLRELYGRAIGSFKRREDLEARHLGLPDLDRARFARRLKPAGFALDPKLDQLLPAAPFPGTYEDPPALQDPVDFDRLYESLDQVTSFGEPAQPRGGDADSPKADNTLELSLRDQAYDAIRNAQIFQIISEGELELLEEIVEIVRNGVDTEIAAADPAEYSILHTMVAGLRQQGLLELDISGLRSRFEPSGTASELSSDF